MTTCFGCVFESSFRRIKVASEAKVLSSRDRLFRVLYLRERYKSIYDLISDAFSSIFLSVVSVIAFCFIMIMSSKRVTVLSIMLDITLMYAAVSLKCDGF